MWLAIILSSKPLSDHTTACQRSSSSGQHVTYQIWATLETLIISCNNPSFLPAKIHRLQQIMKDPILGSTTMNARGRAILCVCIACGVLETVAVALRFLARRRMKARLRIDDWLIFASLWPNYAMIITGGFRTYRLSSIDILEADYHSGWRRQSRITNILPYPSADGRVPPGRDKLDCVFQG